VSDSPIQPLTKEQEALAEAKANEESPFHEDMVVIDQAMGKIIGGMPDITMSTDLAIMAVQGKGVRKWIGIIGLKLLNLLEPDHGAKATVADLQRAKAAEAVLEAQLQAEKESLP
jgi:hypothetical protein